MTSTKDEIEAMPALSSGHGMIQANNSHAAMIRGLCIVIDALRERIGKVENENSRLLAGFELLINDGGRDELLAKVRRLEQHAGLDRYD